MLGFTLTRALFASLAIPRALPALELTPVLTALQTFLCTQRITTAQTLATQRITRLRQLATHAHLHVSDVHQIPSVQHVMDNSLTTLLMYVLLFVGTTSLHPQ